ncbi:MAG: 6-phosphogluconolactonase [Phycisphaerae bacterium]
MVNNRQIIVLRDATELATAAAKMIMQSGAEAIARRGRFIIALSGGSTPAMAYAIIHDHYSSQTDWAKWYIFLGDERAVPVTDPQSNLGMAKRTLLHGLPIPETQIFAVQTQLSVAAAAADYEQRIREFFGTAEPRFDLILLGLGDDGHTASLFPGLAARHEKIKLVTYSPPGTLPPPLDRITFTFPLINLARKVVFLMAGEKKKAVAAQLLAPDVNAELIPAANVRPQDGELVYMMDQACAGKAAPAA